MTRSIIDLDLPRDDGSIIRRRRKPSWVRPTLEDFYAVPGQLLCFDQTLTSTGVAILRYDPDYGIGVDYTTVLSARTDLESHEGTYAKAKDIEELVGREIARFRLYSANPRRIVYERPPVTGFRTESSLLAGYAVAKHGGDQASMVSNNHMKAVLLGPKPKSAPAWTKAHVKAAVETYVLPPEPGMPWNEHTRDAVALGLTYLYDEKKASR